jgi:hypothetical protein
VDKLYAHGARGLGTAGLVAAVALLALASGADARGEASADLLPRDAQDECVDVPDCRVVTGKLLLVPPRQNFIVRVQCPPDARVFWNWGFEQTRHLGATLLGTTSSGTSGGTDTAVIRIHNPLSVSGSARVLLGCSARVGEQRFRFTHHGVSAPVDEGQ